MPDNWKRAATVLTVLLAIQAAVFYSRSLAESTPPPSPLASFPDLPGWRMTQNGVVEQEVQDVLKADDLLTRQYVSTTAPVTPANLFVAYFHTQRTGKAPHSPKNCLPGSGWLWITSDFLDIPVGEAEPLRVNRYVVAKGQDKSVVVYWYQTSRRTIASEYWAKAYLVADSIRYNRSDTAMIRVVVPVRGDDIEQATGAAVSMAKAAYPAMRRYLPE